MQHKPLFTVEATSLVKSYTIFYIRFMIEKLILRTEIKDYLLDYISSGKVKPGERLSLPAIADEIDVSVTPIREALTQLTETGLVSYIANRGFFVSELSVKEASEIYELIALLECEAIENINFSNEKLQELREINNAMLEAIENREKLILDHQFHKKLIEGYENDTAHKIIEDLRIKVILYDYTFWDDSLAGDSVPTHNEIIDLITEGKTQAAKKSLRRNWLVGVEHILKQLSE